MRTIDDETYIILREKLDIIISRTDNLLSHIAHNEHMPVEENIRLIFNELRSFEKDLIRSAKHK